MGTRPPVREEKTGKDVDDGGCCVCGSKRKRRKRNPKPSLPPFGEIEQTLDINYLDYLAPNRMDTSDNYQPLQEVNSIQEAIRAYSRYMEAKGEMTAVIGQKPMYQQKVTTQKSAEILSLVQKGMRMTQILQQFPGMQRIIAGLMCNFLLNNGRQSVCMYMDLLEWARLQ